MSLAVLKHFIDDGEQEGTDQRFNKLKLFPPPDRMLAVMLWMHIAFICKQRFQI